MWSIKLFFILLLLMFLSGKLIIECSDIIITNIVRIIVNLLFLIILKVEIYLFGI